jgi:hypothetical protein
MTSSKISFVLHSTLTGNNYENEVRNKGDLSVVDELCAPDML